MTQFSITEVPLSSVPLPRRSGKWTTLMERTIAAAEAGNAVLVAVMSDNDATNFAAYMRPKGYTVRRRRSGEGYILWVEKHA